MFRGFLRKLMTYFILLAGIAVRRTDRENHVELGEMGSLVGAVFLVDIQESLACSVTLGEVCVD